MWSFSSFKSQPPQLYSNCIFQGTSGVFNINGASGHKCSKFILFLAVSGSFDRTDHTFPLFEHPLLLSFLNFNF